MVCPMLDGPFKKCLPISTCTSFVPSSSCPFVHLPQGRATNTLLALVLIYVVGVASGGCWLSCSFCSKSCTPLLCFLITQRLLVQQSMNVLVLLYLGISCWPLPYSVGVFNVQFLLVLASKQWGLRWSHQRGMPYISCNKTKTTKKKLLGLGKFLQHTILNFHMNQ